MGASARRAFLATLGNASIPNISTPTGLRRLRVAPRPRAMSMNGEAATPLGLKITIRCHTQGCSRNRNPGLCCTIPLGLAPSSQPWAGGRNPLGIEMRGGRRVRDSLNQWHDYCEELIV